MNAYYKYFIVLITTFLFACQTTAKVDDSMTTEEKMEELVKVDETEHHAFEYFFDWKKYNIKPDQKAILDKDLEAIKKEISKHPSATLLLEGHADERGTQEYNETLSENRAKTIAAYLIEKGIHVPMTIKFYGHMSPRRGNTKDEAQWSQNRRVDVVVVLPANATEDASPTN